MKDHKVRDSDVELNMLFQPDALAAYDHLKTLERTTFVEPEKRLMFAVLEDAILCLQRFINATGTKETKLQQDAVAWVFESQDDSVFSFEFVCNTVGLNPEFLRMGLREWKVRNGSKSASYKTVAQMSHRGPQRSRLRY